MKIAVAGGSGYIGSHLASHLIRKGHSITVLDFQAPVGIFSNEMAFHELDLRDENATTNALATSQIEALFHLGSPSVMEESFKDSIGYIQDAEDVANSLANSCARAGVRHLVFSSSCSVYGERLNRPANESSLLSPMSPYAQSKVAAENALAEFQSELSIGICRFFNVVGVDNDAGLLERHEPETHVLPRLVQANITGEDFTIFGDDFPTADGTAMRDYVDVRDISVGLSMAMDVLVQWRPKRSEIWNLGMEHGISVKTLVKKVEEATGKRTNLRLMARREGDPASISADVSKAKTQLRWMPAFTIDDSIASVVRSVSQRQEQRRGGN
jgi:UDP-glucose 4-epimerase